MKSILIFILSLISIAILLISKPYIQKYQTKQKYEFKLQSFDGDIKLSDFRGKIVAVYFGYMYCPDVCPNTLSLLSQALDSFSSKKLKDFQGIFISVDPLRDHFKNLKDYSTYFHSNFIGVTSDQNNIKTITKNYGSYFVLEKNGTNDIDYTVAHTSYIYLFDRNGNLVSKLNHITSSEEIFEALNKIL